MREDTESRYRRGVALWADRDLDGAVEVLEAALAVSPGPVRDGWWFAVSRALAQIAMESDDLDPAERHLRRLPGSGVGDAQTAALRGRRLLLMGDGDSAAVEISAAVGRLSEERAQDVGSLMNGALALMWCAESLAELGLGHEASDLASRARARTARAGVDDPVVGAVLTLIEAAAARLLGDSSRAVELLAQVDRTVSGDVDAQTIRERARLAWDDGDLVTADRLYSDAIARSGSLGYVALTRQIASERPVGPPRLRIDPDPIENWAERQLKQVLADHRPYAIVVRLVVDSHPGRFSDLEERVKETLAANRDLGFVDGTGTDGEVWELFIDGDDPEALWSAIRRHIELASPAPGSELDIRRAGLVETIPLEAQGIG